MINMTKKKSQDEPNQFELALYRLRVIAKKIENKIALNDDECTYIVKALWEIGNGEDPYQSLGIKSIKGQKRTNKNITKQMRIDYVLSWIAAAMKPKPEGLGYDLETAIEEAATFEYNGLPKLSEQTIKHYWDNNPQKHRSDFKPPLRSLPLKEPKS
jgi:hypothetical protein